MRFCGIGAIGKSCGRFFFVFIVFVIRFYNSFKWYIKDVISNSHYIHVYCSILVIMTSRLTESPVNDLPVCEIFAWL